MNTSHLRQFPQITAPYCIALEKSIGAIIFRHVKKGDEQKIEYLLMRYPHGHWEFPRGHVEPGEQNEHITMYREIEEETGITKKDLEVQKNFREYYCFSYRARGDEKTDRIKNKKCLFIRKRVVFYLAKSIKDDVLLSHEHQEFEWLPIDQAIEKLTFSNAKKVIIKANRHLIKKSD